MERNPEHTLQLYMRYNEEFRLRNQRRFFGGKVIYSVIRSLSKQAIKEGVIQAIYFQKNFPNYFAGFDLVGQEDLGFSLYHFIDELLLPQQRGDSLQYIFHAGMTT